MIYTIYGITRVFTYKTLVAIVTKPFKMSPFENAEA